MDKHEQISTADNSTPPIDGLNYLEVTARIYADESGRFPDAEKAAGTVVEALGSLVGARQSVMVDTQPVTLSETDQGWMKSPWPGFQLPPRLTQIANGITRGLSNTEIASEIHLSPATVKGYVANTLNRANTRKRSGIPTRFWRIIVPDLLDHSAMPKPAHLRRTSARP